MLLRCILSLLWLVIHLVSAPTTIYYQPQQLTEKDLAWLVPNLSALVPDPVALAAALPNECWEQPYRSEWRRYAALYDWPLEEVEQIVQAESRGDLCAVNSSSGATCWYQIHPGGELYFDPLVCTSTAYSKWVDGGGSFDKHWRQWWR